MSDSKSTEETLQSKLENILDGLYWDAHTHGGSGVIKIDLTDDGFYKKAESQIMQLFDQELAKRVEEARIDELKNRLRVQFIPSHWERLRNETNSWAKYVDRRIEQLEASLNQTNKGEE